MPVLNGMNNGPYVPDRGDYIWIVLDPRVGHEQSGRRPAIVLSRRLFTERTGLAVVCPITSKVKGLPFEIRLKTTVMDGAILPIHVRTVDVIAREARFIAKASPVSLRRTVEAVEALIT